MQSLAMRSFALCGAAARGQAAAPAGIAASAAGPAPRPRIARRRCLLVAAAAEAGSDAPAAELQSFATTAPLRVRGMDGKLSEVRVDDAWRGLAAGSRRLVAAPACRLHLAALFKEQNAAAAAVHTGRCMHAGCHACEARPRWHVPALRNSRRRRLARPRAGAGLRADAGHSRRVRCVRLIRDSAVRGHQPQGGQTGGEGQAGAQVPWGEPRAPPVLGRKPRCSRSVGAGAGVTARAHSAPSGAILCRRAAADRCGRAWGGERWLAS